MVFVSRRCPYCLTFRRIVERLRLRFPDVDFEFVDVERNPELAEKFEVEVLPTTILMRDGETIGGIMGFADEKTVENSLREQIRRISDF